MNKTIMIMAAVSGFSAAAFGQGTVIFGTSGTAASKVSITDSFGGTSLTLAPAADTFYYALFASATASSVLGSTSALIGVSPPHFANYVFYDSNWTFVSYGDSTGGAGRFFATGSLNSDESVTIPFATAGSPINLAALGWSANIGSTYQSVEAFLAGGLFVNGLVGESAVATIPAGNVPGTGFITPEFLFGTGPGQVGGLILGPVIPEPTTLALGVMGGLSLLALRRRQKRG